MSMSENNEKLKIEKIKKPLNINIGLIFFLVILIYIIICVVMYFSSKHITGYEVKTGSLSVSNVYEGIALRDEIIIDSGTAGYVNYFATEGEKVGYNNLVCCVDETGALQDYMIKNSGDGTNTLTEKDLSEIKNEMVNFSTSYDPKDFMQTYEFKYAIQGDVLKFSNRNLLNSLEDIKAQSSLMTLCNSPKSGVVVYTIDGFEKKTPTEINKEWFDKSKYEDGKIQLINNAIVAPGDPLYKLTGNERWSIIISVDEERYNELIEEGYVKVKFLKNQFESWAKVEGVDGTDDGHYIKLSFTNSMISFVTDRFITIELLTAAETGLKIPNSAIVEKSFFLVPESYITKGGKNGDDGVLRETYNEDGTMVPEFVATSIYSNADGEVYLDDSSLRLGDRIDMPDSEQTYVISKSATLIGVYNINKGYADFKQIQILNQNEEYSIVQSNTQYGLVPYDYIVLDASSVDTDEFIYE